MPGVARPLLSHRRHKATSLTAAVTGRPTPPRSMVGRPATANPHSHGTQLCLKAMRSRHFGAGSSAYPQATRGHSLHKIAGSTRTGNRFRLSYRLDPCTDPPSAPPGEGEGGRRLYGEWERGKIVLKLALGGADTWAKEPGLYLCPGIHRSPARQFVQCRRQASPPQTSPRRSLSPLEFLTPKIAVLCVRGGGRSAA